MDGKRSVRLKTPSVIIGLHFVAYSLLLVGMKAVPSGPFVVVVSDPLGAAGTPMQVISRAGGQFVEATGSRWATVAYSDAPDFPSRLRQSGALFVINYLGEAGCRGRSS